VAIFTGTQTKYDLVGIREDLSNDIYNISPVDTPFMSNVGRSTAKNTLFEWQTDALASATQNSQIDGDDVTTFGTTAASTVRSGNYTQISRKLAITSGTADAVNKAGRQSELAYQLVKRSKEIKRDMEFICLYPQAGSAGNTANARTTASMNCWVKTNVDKHSGGTNPTWTSGVPTATRTDGTLRTFTETILKAACKLVFDNGGDLKMLLLGSDVKQTFSGFSGVATKTFDWAKIGPMAIIGAADVYVSDFGTLQVVVDRFQRSRDGWLVDPSMASVAYLRPFSTEPLAKTGDAEKRMLLVEWGLKVNNELAHGLCADIQA
jgi:hypothetical protein